MTTGLLVGMTVVIRLSWPIGLYYFPATVAVLVAVYPRPPDRSARSLRIPRRV